MTSADIPVVSFERWFIVCHISSISVLLLLRLVFIRHVCCDCLQQLYPIISVSQRLWIRLFAPDCEITTTVGASWLWICCHRQHAAACSYAPRAGPLERRE